jgi:hypothetical protein
MMVEVLVLRFAPLFAGERAEERVNIAFESVGTEAVKFVDHLL